MGSALKTGDWWGARPIAARMESLGTETGGVFFTVGSGELEPGPGFSFWSPSQTREGGVKAVNAGFSVESQTGATTAQKEGAHAPVESNLFFFCFFFFFL